MKARPHATASGAARKDPGSTIAMVASCLALLVSTAALMLSLLVNAEKWASTEIRALIAAEPLAAMKHDVSWAASLYCPDALIRDANNTSPSARWQGRQAIEQRYRDLPQFVQLAHVDVIVIEIGILAGSARATSSTDGVILSRKPGTDSLKTISNFNRDIWEFKRVDRLPLLPWTGKWKIASFTY